MFSIYLPYLYRQFKIGDRIEKVKDNHKVMEVISLLREELKASALALVELTNDFKLLIEDYIEEDGAMFVWMNDEQDERITIHIDLFGQLRSLSIDRQDKNLAPTFLSIEERNQRAEQFLLSHYPNALNEFFSTRHQKQTDCIRFYYEQIVFDLPLENAGCFIEVDPVGNIIEFTYDGVEDIPRIPDILISKEKLIEDVRSRLDFQLTIAKLYAELHNVEVDGLYLVYEPKQSFMSYKASILKPTLTVEHEEDEQETYVSLTAKSKMAISKDLSIEEIVGIPKTMEVIRELDAGDKIGRVWRNPEWKKKEKDLLTTNFLIEDIEDTVNVFTSKETGSIKSFAWFKERSGNLQLSREACYEKAVCFLQLVFPEYDQYLQLIIREHEEEEDVKEWFTFYMHNGQGIPLQSEIVMIVINRTTGQVDFYSGPNVDVVKLHEVSTEPTISQQEAKELFIDHLDFELVWKKDYNNKIESNFLVYEACERFTKREIRYIDAITGKIITEQRI